MRNPTQPIDSSKAAEILGLSRSQVNRMATTGSLPVLYKLPGIRGAYIFELADIEALLSGESSKVAS